ncbi:hypothetical protein SLNSH_07635 [Alsobacter soli]|uniref:Uncharacterized protein n=1 Tax=Alsobacter soli TaxID=2109933 RepID=A0A2T1HUW4_9HYPH|nr:hypothetical protein [Alsobacter soli]PSC05455.1 hypothetical protein SLNSH_07635 [Alsobacter soli]
MTEQAAPMDIGRFGALAEAYGGAIERWPAEHRDDARRLAATEAGRAILGRALALDAELDRYAVDAPAAALVGRVVEAASGGLARKRRRRLWWAALGFAGVGLAGAFAGVAVATAVLPPASPAFADFGTWTVGDEADGAL